MVMEDEKNDAERSQLELNLTLSDALSLPGYLYTILLDGRCLFHKTLSFQDGAPTFEAGALYPWPEVKRQLWALGYQNV